MRRFNKQFWVALGAGLFLLSAGNALAVTDEEFINYSIEYQNAIIKTDGDDAHLKATHDAIAKKYKTDSKEWKAYEAALIKDKPRFDRIMQTINEKASENMMKHLEEEMQKEQ